MMTTTAFWMLMTLMTTMMVSLMQVQKQHLAYHMRNTYFIVIVMSLEDDDWLGHDEM
jgi:hypothetical protein